MIRHAFAAAFMLAAAGPVLAQERPHLSQRYVACHERSHGETVQESICAQAEIVGQDDRLNKAYQQVMRQLASDPDRKDTLRAEERSWLKQRDYDCKVNGHTINATCLVVKTAQRADELEHQVRF